MSAKGKSKEPARPKMPLDKLKIGKVAKLPQPKPAPGPLFVRPADLAFHPMLERVAMLPDLITRETKLGNAQGKNRAAHKAAAADMEHDFEALIRSIRFNGLREKIKVVQGPKGYLVVDGRHRLGAVCEIINRHQSSHCKTAIRFRDVGVPCEVVKEEEVAAIIQDAVTRRHMSKGARAYLAVLMTPEVATEAKARQKEGTPSALSAEGLAARAGVSVRLIEDAVSLYRTFESRKDLRKKFEDSIWVGAGLASVKAGIEGFLKLGKTPDGPESEEEKKARLANQWLYTGLGYFNSIGRYWEEYERLDEDQEKALIERATEVFQKAPESIRNAIKAAIA